MKVKQRVLLQFLSYKLCIWCKEKNMYITALPVTFQTDLEFVVDNGRPYLLLLFPLQSRSFTLLVSFIVLLVTLACC